MREILNRLRVAFDGLSGRERVLVWVAIGLTAAIVIYFTVVQTTIGLRDNAKRRLDAAEQQLRVMSSLHREFADVNERLTSVEQRIKDGSRGNLRTTLESLAQASLVKVESMEPQATPSNDRYREEKVEVGLKEVTLAQAVSYLHQIESSQQVLSVKSLRMRTRKDKPSYLDVTFTVSAFEPL
jgi:type II secretory pathway component PulM